MSTVNDIYAMVCYDLLEDGGLVLDLLTTSQFIDILNLVLQDWHQKTGYCALVQTQQAISGTARYTVPDVIMRADHVFLGGVLLEPTTVDGLNRGMRGWRADTGLPTRWHADELPLKLIELAPVPNDTGVAPTSGAQTGWNVVSSGVTYTPAQHRDLTLVGPQLPATATFVTSCPLCFGTLGSPTAYVPQDFVLGYLAFGVLARIFSGDNELKDPARAQWCQAEYDDGVSLVKALTDEASGSAE